MSMNEVFIWLSGHRIIDREIFNGYKIFSEFSLKIIPLWGTAKTFFIPKAKGLNNNVVILRNIFLSHTHGTFSME